MRELAEELEKELSQYEEAFQKLKAENVARVNELARKQNVPMIWIPVPAK
jgi:hypothetical protein